MVRRDKLPSFPVIRRLVQCVLVPQMTYAFAFLYGKIHNERITDSQTDEKQSTNTNIYIKLKNNILRPLHASLHLPFHAHPEALFIESRLLNIPSLIAFSTARLLHRWLGMSDPSHNAAASLFRQHHSRYDSLPSYHPCVSMCSALAQQALPLLHFNPSNTDAFAALPVPNCISAYGNINLTHGN